MKAPVIFLDKDGTLVKDVPYNVDPELICLEPGAARGLRRLAQAGYHFVVVSNQSGVARGYFKAEALGPVAARLNEIIREATGVGLDGFYFCPHHPQGSLAEYAIECECRKPRPGLLFKAAAELGVNLEQAWMVGDILNDVEAGKRAGCRTILVDNGNETEWKPGLLREPNWIVKDLEEAAEVILTCQVWDI